MEITSAEFIASYPRESLCPKDGRAEFAFIGRSNVGKSSLINMLTRKGLAKVSGTPGKTQLLNFFLINKTWYLVDLPGYGYAKVSKVQQKNLAAMIGSYLRSRSALMCAFILIDSNLSPMQIDLDFINGLGEHEIPFAICFTKTDRIGKPTLEKNIELFLTELSKTWENPPPYFITSAVRKTGKAEVLGFIEEALKTI